MLPIISRLEFADLKQPAVFAHRGSSANAPENTMAAFELAMVQGADGIELDAKLSADGHVVVIHDQTVDRTTNGTGRVDRLTLTELQTLDAGSYFNASFAGEKVSALADVFACIEKRAYIMVELKNYASPRDNLPERVVELIRKYHLEQTLLLSSFNPTALRRAHRILPEVPLGLLTFRGKKGAIYRSWIGRLIPHQVFHPNWKDVKPALIANNHRRGVRVIPYVVNDLNVMQELFHAGVDGIITDNPPLAIKVLATSYKHRNTNPKQAT